MKSKSRKSVSALKLGVLLILILIMASPFAYAKSKKPKFKAMTRNLYLGADIFKVVDAALNPDPNKYGLDVPMAVAEVYQTMLFTNFWARAEALADEIVETEPDVIGLQEVSTYYIQTPSDFFIGNPVQANTEVIDFYTVLNDALEARGMHYTAFINTNADVEFPMLTDLQFITDPPSIIASFDDVRMVDHDVVLVKKNTPAVEIHKDNYENFLSMDLNGDEIDDVEFRRGYLIVEATIKGLPYLVVNTHLEIRDGIGSPYRFYQSAQMMELLDTIDFFQDDLDPIIMVGDFNSDQEDQPGEFDPDGEGPYPGFPYIPPYMQAVEAGYLDTWLLQKKYDEGYTSGFDDLVSDPTAELTSRIDLIFVDPLDLIIDKVKCDIVGDEVSDMVPNPSVPGMYLWPSDHAGVVAKLKFLRPE
jgi:endonuclease/exonuclease/phosphatase family metal-dependent hydrolase